MTADSDIRRQQTLLIVDDHASLRRALRWYLRNAFPHCQVEVAADGRDCLAACSSSKLDVVILDKHLPDSDGIALTATIRRLHPAVRVVLISYAAEAIYGKHALAAGACSYVCKDQIMTGLIPAVASALGDHGS